MTSSYPSDIDIFDFIQSCDYPNIEILTNRETGNVNLEYENKKYIIHLTINNSSLKVEPGDKKVENYHLANLVSSKGFNKTDQIFELMEFIKNSIGELNSYCVGCYKKLEFQTDTFITCGNKQCDYKFEELKFGDPVTDRVRADPELTRFLLTSAIDAITCPRKYDIFEPFPSHFLLDKVEADELVRGEVSKLVGKNYDVLKDFSRLETLVSNLDIDKFLDIVDMCNKDEEVLNILGEEMYTLVRFILMSCKVDLIIDNDLLAHKTGGNKLCKIYRINHPSDKEEEFKKLRGGDSATHYLFHGSRWHNWYSILRNGLKNCSKTKLMTAGAAYGNGIYLSDNLGLSYRYGLSSSKSVVGVFEVLGEKSRFCKNNSVYVVPDGKHLIQRYLIIVPTKNSSRAITELNTVFNTNIYKKREETKKVVLSKGIKKLIREYKKIAKQDPKELGFNVQIDKNSAYEWKVFITKYDEQYPIGQDMKELGIKEIELEVNFPENYPFGPPFIRIVQPRFKYLTGHVTQAGALCMEILTPKAWSPACSIESLIVTIKSEIIEGEGRIDRANYNRPYSIEEAKSSFVRVARSHRWL